MNNIYLVWLSYRDSYSSILMEVFSSRQAAEDFIKIADSKLRSSLTIQEFPVLDRPPV